MDRNLGRPRPDQALQLIRLRSGFYQAGAGGYEYGGFGGFAVKREIAHLAVVLLICLASRGLAELVPTLAWFFGWSLGGVAIGGYVLLDKVGENK